MFRMKAESLMRIAFVLFIITESAFGSAPSDLEEGSFRLTILHNNDMHARFEQTGVMSDKCSKSDADGNRCYGGFARVAYKVREFKERARLGEAPPVLFLNAGDTYIGTPWFIVHKEKIASDFLRILKPDAISLGNHEFDEGTENLAQFLKSVDFPVLVANLNLDEHPNLKSEALKPSTTFDIDGRKVGVIGYLTPETTNLVVGETVKFFDEIEMINKEAARLKAEGINIIIALGHSGLEKDKQIAAQCPEVDLIIGGHSHTFLFTGKAPSTESPEDGYPVVVTQPRSGKRVPVVQAYAFTKYLGHLELKFDVGGNLIEIDGAPILLDASVPRSHDVLELLDKYRPGVLEFVNGHLGTTKVLLDGVCRRSECNLGNFITDAMVDFVTTSNKSEGLWTEAAIAFITGGNIRASINHASNQGQVTKEDLSAVLPFGKKLEIVEVSGKALLEALEHSVRHYTLGEARGEFPQVSGIHAKFDMSRPSGKRAMKVKVRCAESSPPTYRELEIAKSYKIVTFDFLARGGDGFVMFTSSTIRKTNETGFDVVKRYLEKLSPISPAVEGRIEIENSVQAQPLFVPFNNAVQQANV